MKKYISTSDQRVQQLFADLIIQKGLFVSASVKKKKKKKNFNFSPFFFLLPIVSQVSILSAQLKLDKFLTINLVKIKTVSIYSSGDASGQLEQDVATRGVCVFARPNVQCHFLGQQNILPSKTEFDQHRIVFQANYLHFLKFHLKNVGNLERAKSS